MKTEPTWWIGDKGIETYKVGFFSDFSRLYTYIFGRQAWHRSTPLPTRWQAFKYFIRNVLASYKRRSYWNGYLAEFHYPPEGLAYRKCGHGWMRKRALKRLGWQYMISNLSESEWRRWNP